MNRNTQWADIRPAWLRKLIVALFGPIATLIYMGMWVVAGPIIGFCEIMSIFTEAWHGRRAKTMVTS